MSKNDLIAKLREMERDLRRWAQLSGPGYASVIRDAITQLDK